MSEAAEVTHEVTTAIQSAFDKLSELAMTYGPKAVDLGAAVVRANAYGHLLHAWAAFTAGAVCLVISGISLIIVSRTQSDVKVETALGVFLGSILLGLGLLLGSSFGLLDYWNWVALSDPKLALAHEIMVKAGIGG